MRSLSLLRFTLALLLSVTASAQTTVLYNATLIDGTGSPAQPHVDITLRDGLVISVAQTAAVAPTGSIDCTGKSIIPGLISAHSHVGLLLNNAEPSASAYTAENVTAALNQFERYGVTTIIALGANRDLGYDLRAQQRAGKISGATFLTAGRGIGVTGGAPPLLVAPDQVDRPTTPEEARKDVDQFAALHADIVKVWVDPLHGKSPEIAPSVYAATIDEAHQKHLHVAAHVYALEDARILVSDGIDVLGHSIRDQPVFQAFTESLIQHHTWYIPTLALDESFTLYASEPAVMQSNFFRQAAGPQLLAKLQAPGYSATTLADPQTAQHQRDEVIARHNFKTLYDAGVQIAFGTDSGAAVGRIPGFTEHRELEDLVHSGITPLQAIAIATGNTGELIHTLDPTLNVGIIAPGYSADLIILSADPLADITNTRRISAIYHRGRLVSNPAPQN